MKKILWLHNNLFIKKDKIFSGSWVQALAEYLQSSGKVQIYHIALGNVKEVTRQDHLNIPQWIIPNRKNKLHGQIPPKQTCVEIARIEKEIQPDLVHLWGTESIWCSVYEQGYIKSKTLIDMQGILSQCAVHYYGGLTFKEKLRCIHLKEIIMPWRTLFHKKKVFEERGQFENRCLRKFKYISYQSEWVKNQLSTINPDASYYHTKIMIRDSFYDAEPWIFRESGKAPVLFSSCNAAVTFKGIHVLLKTIAVLKQRYPDIQLRLAGQINVGNKLLDGYSVFLNQLIKNYRLQQNVLYLGMLNEFQIIKELQESNVCVIPSFVESYCLGFAEAMIVGTPTVVSFAGAMPELAIHKEEALFYNSMDYGTCAVYIDQLLQDKILAESISKKARAKRMKENNKKEILSNQLDIYDNILTN